MDSLTEACKVSKHFGASTVVSAVDLAVGPSEVVGLLGANGAGKTTLIRLLLGLLQPTEGQVRLFGEPPSILTRRRVGYVPQTLGLYSGLTVAENWSFTAAAFHNTAAAIPESIAAWKGKLVGGIPLGAQRQVAFATALSHHPEILILDEPTSGVALARARLWEDIRQASDRGAGVLVTTHNMEEAEQCDHLAVMAEGKVVATGPVSQIIGDRTVVEVRSRDRNRVLTRLDAEGFTVQVHGEALHVAGRAADVGPLLSSEGYEADVKVVPANLEEAFVEIVTKMAIT